MCQKVLCNFGSILELHSGNISLESQSVDLLNLGKVSKKVNLYLLVE